MEYVLQDMWLIVLILAITGYKGWKIYLCAKYNKNPKDFET